MRTNFQVLDVLLHDFDAVETEEEVSQRGQSVYHMRYLKRDVKQKHSATNQLFQMAQEVLMSYKAWAIFRRKKNRDLLFHMTISYNLGLYRDLRFSINTLREHSFAIRKKMQTMYQNL